MARHILERRSRNRAPQHKIEQTEEERAVQLCDAAKAGLGSLELKHTQLKQEFKSLGGSLDELPSIKPYCFSDNENPIEAGYDQVLVQSANTQLECRQLESAIKSLKNATIQDGRGNSAGDVAAALAGKQPEA